MKWVFAAVLPAALAAAGADRPAMPAITQPILFNTPEADKVLAALQVFPPDNPWNEDVSKLPVHPMSKQWLATMHAGSTLLHPDFGGPPYGLPYQVVSNATPTHRAKFYWASESDRVPYPFGRLPTGTPPRRASGP